jgi:hypothetical protein
LVNVEKSGPSGVLDTNILSEGFFTHMNRVNCAAPFAFGQQMVYGTDNGVYMSDVPVPSAPTGARKEPVKMLSLSKVTQVDILEEYQLLLVLSEGRVFTLDTLDPYDPMAGLKHAKRISSHTTFFKVGSCFNKTSVCVVKSSPLSTTIKLFEPIVENGRGRAKPSFRKLVQGENDSLQIYREFIIPTESSSVHYMNTRLIVGCTNGFELVDLETLDTQGLFNPADESLGFVSARKTPSRPMAIFKIDSEFLVCYDGKLLSSINVVYSSSLSYRVRLLHQPIRISLKTAVYGPLAGSTNRIRFVVLLYTHLCFNVLTSSTFVFHSHTSPIYPRIRAYLC